MFYAAPTDMPVMRFGAPAASPSVRRYTLCAMSTRSTAVPLRAALRVPAGPLPAYLASAIQAVLDTPGISVPLVLLIDAPARSTAPRQRLTASLTLIFDRWERRLLAGGPGALTLRPAPAWGAETLVRRVGGATDESDLLLAHAVDVFVDLGPERSVVPSIAPPAGRWCLRYASIIAGPRGPRLDRPSSTRPGLGESLLSIQMPDGTSLESEVGVSALRRVGFTRDRDAVYWRSAALPARRLARLVAGEAVPGPADAAASDGDGPTDRRGGWRPPIAGLLREVVNKSIRRIVYDSHWVVLVRERAADQRIPRDLSGFQEIPAPAGRFYADPFIVARDDRVRVLVEDCPVGQHRGRISALVRTDAGDWSVEGVVLDDQEHRAYPHALVTDAGLVITPDGGRSGGIDIFLESVPGSGLSAVTRCLVDLSASDPTLFWHEGTYWLFVTVTGHGMSPWDELHLFHAPVLAGPWVAHPRNPIVADVRRSRPAGRIIRDGARLIRPAQDCSEAYGRRIVLNAISRLSTVEYQELPIGSIEPSGVFGIERTHTYTADGPYEVLDGYRRTTRLSRGRRRR